MMNMPATYAYPASLALMVAGSSGCASRAPLRVALPGACQSLSAPTPADVNRAVERASKWLRLDRVPPGIAPCTAQELARLGAVAEGAGAGGEALAITPDMLAIRSFPDDSEGVLAGRSYVYDNALALLWYTWTGDKHSARGIAETLVASQDAQGAWGAYLPLDGDDCYNAGYVRTGMVSWVAYALSYYAGEHGSSAAKAGAERAAKYLERAAVADIGKETLGLLTGGRGRWTADERFDGAHRMDSAVTEHQFDAQLALQSMGRKSADKLAKQIMGRLWLEDEGRFALAAHPGRIDRRRALDAAGAWGTLWLLSRGDRGRARRSLDYTLLNFSTADRSLRGYRPYLDPVEGPRSVKPEDLIFVEGTLGVGLAAHRLGEPRVAREALGLAAQLSCSARGGLPYANVEAAGFSILPGAASTLWFLLLEREIRTGEPSPLFHPSDHRGDGGEKTHIIGDA